MTIPLRHPQEAAQSVSQSWFAIARHTARGLQPFTCDGELAAIPGYDLARAVARVYEAHIVPLGVSALAPDLVRWREVMALPETRTPPMTFNIDALDLRKEHEQYQRAQGVGSNSAWGR